ncbi:NADP-dependent oxidoreductase [Dyadobacter arcticus]|uniref:NADPH:quinone reductase-like Zn-dependent oxidoreductase n=1 Tax=Dyadobacter arcticus TaxID=1078754 RepID=A0ABX0UJ11_9BACT|nr:NADP-dependent oxidoreductase [Dyadobacter arcticus]NIJ52997.1 NADPH:quinone reductase-like Zn-dependent oxidoreductase [Dyadobacter arcticus]
MKAITLNQTGGVENFIFSEVETPAIKPNEVLIEVKAIGINPVDAFVRNNQQALTDYLSLNGDEKNVILGWDISGTIVNTGNEVTTFKTGDDVFGMVNFPGQGKAYAEYVAAPVGQLALKPANISFEEAAAATLAALTAWQSLVTYAKVKKGDRVLIHAAGGGVGHYAVQIAKHFGAYVIGTSSAPKKDFIIELGVDEFIDHTSEKFEEKVKNADIVLDPIFGEEHLLRSLEAVKTGGSVITLLTFFTDEKVKASVKEKDLYTHRLEVISNGEDMRQIAGMLADGSIKSFVTLTFPFSDLPKAHTKIETGKTTGKIVVAL